MLALLSGLKVGLVWFTYVFAAATAICVYFMPTLLAIDNKKSNKRAIALLNLLLGWTGVVWVGALVWASTVERQHGETGTPSQ
jgi:ABC-type sugar transport system permease subunit